MKIPKQLVQRPTIFAAIIVAVATVTVAAIGVIGGSISSYFQHQTDVQKLKTEILLNLVHSPEDLRKEYTRLLIQSGTLPDEDGSICMAFVGENCPIKATKIEKPN